MSIGYLIIISKSVGIIVLIVVFMLIFSPTVGLACYAYPAEIQTDFGLGVNNFVFSIVLFATTFVFQPLFNSALKP